MVHPECLPIPIPQGDPFYPPINITTGRPFCLAFTRCSKNGKIAKKNREITQNEKKCSASLKRLFFIFCEVIFIYLGFETLKNQPICVAENLGENEEKTVFPLKSHLHIGTIF